MTMSKIDHAGYGNVAEDVSRDCILLIKKS